MPSHGLNLGNFQKLKSQSLGLYSIVLLYTSQSLGGVSFFFQEGFLVIRTGEICTKYQVL